MDATFTTIDYFFLVLMLLLSLIVGLYYAFFKKQNTAKEYLHGGKSMNFIPVSLSIVSSSLSGITLISVPTEIYYYGFQYVLNILATILICAISYFFVTPVFFNLQLTSVYQYLELRFSSKVKVLSSLIFSLQMFLYLPLVIYAPGLAVAQVTNINVHYITPVICAVCFLYTVFGGIKAVIWTDALQFFVMVGSVLVVVIMGVVSVGGIGNVFSIAYNTRRLDVNFDLDPTVRDTFWSVFSGCFASLLGMYLFSQGTIQKYLSLKDYRAIKKAHIWSIIGLTILFLLCTFSGLVILAKYVHCDPVAAKDIQKPDQLVAYYVMDIARSLPGLSGLFVAGVISAGLSTLSAAMNSLAATMYNDFLKAALPNKIVREREALFLKSLVALIGIICIALIYVVEHLGNLLPLFMSLVGLTTGPMAGLFIIGMFIPRVNTKGALCGSISSLMITGWIVMSAQWYKGKGLLKYPPLPVYTDSCNATITTTPRTIDLNGYYADVPSLYKMSHYYYTVIGILIVVVVGVITSYLTKEEEEMNEEYFSPLVHYFRRRFGKKPLNLNYRSVDEALNALTIDSNSDEKKNYT